MLGRPTLKSYHAHLKALVREREKLGLPESFTLQLLLDECELILEASR